MSFYSNFLTMCNNIGKTPSKVVTEVGLKKSAVTRWKAGGKPTDATAQKIADYFGVPVSELTEETKKVPAPILGDELDEVLERLRTRPECRMLFKLADGATPDDVKKTAAIIEALRKVEDK